MILVVLASELFELVLELTDDLADLVADRARDRSRCDRKRRASLRRSVLVILRLAGMMISPVCALTTSSGIFSPRRMLRERLGQLLAQLVVCASCNPPRSALLPLGFGRASVFLRATSFFEETLTSMTMP